MEFHEKVAILGWLGRTGVQFGKDMFTAAGGTAKGLAAIPGIIAKPSRLVDNIKKIYHTPEHLGGGIGNLWPTLLFDIPQVFSDTVGGFGAGVDRINASKTPRQARSAVFEFPGGRK
jgi:hypothetical protein